MKIPWRLIVSNYPKDPTANEIEQLFGHRFHEDQTPLELLSEFLLVATSCKSEISSEIAEMKDFFPSVEQAKNMSSKRFK
jgi:hypothetical protein